MARKAKLNDKQELFCNEYIIDMNGTKAAIRAGYSKRCACEQASRMLAMDKIKERIYELQQERIARTKVDADYVIERLKLVVERCMQAEPVMAWDYNEKKLVETGEYKFDSRGANGALQLLGKHIGMFAEKPKVEETDEKTGVIELPKAEELKPPSTENMEQLNTDIGGDGS